MWVEKVIKKIEFEVFEIVILNLSDQNKYKDMVLRAGAPLKIF